MGKGWNSFGADTPDLTIGPKKRPIPKLVFEERVPLIKKGKVVISKHKPVFVISIYRVEDDALVLHERQYVYDDGELIRGSPSRFLHDMNGCCDRAFIYLKGDVLYGVSFRSGSGSLCHSSLDETVVYDCNGFLTDSRTERCAAHILYTNNGDVSTYYEHGRRYGQYDPGWFSDSD
jgi:hypothetical protein